MEAAPAATTPATRKTVIEPPRGWGFPSLKELWEQRDLLYFMSRRDVAVRYKQSVLGVLWTVAQPLAYAVVFSVFLGLLAKVPSATDIPYPLFAASGMIIWLAFADGLTKGSLSMTLGAAMISKLYFPRLVLPIAAIVPAMIDLIVGFLVIVPIAWAYGFPPDKHLLLFPVVFGLTLATTLGAGLWFAALNVKYRDVVLLVPFIILVGLFITPIIYPISLVPIDVRPLYMVNPMTGILELWRFMLLPTAFPSPFLLAIPVTVSLGMLMTGLIYFKRAEPHFADVI